MHSCRHSLSTTNYGIYEINNSLLNIQAYSVLSKQEHKLIRMEGHEKVNKTAVGWWSDYPGEKLFIVLAIQLFVIQSRQLVKAWNSSGKETKNGTDYQFEEKICYWPVYAVVLMLFQSSPVNGLRTKLWNKIEVQGGLKQFSEENEPFFCFVFSLLEVWGWCLSLMQISYAAKD